jgi:hypothetical protein
MIVIFRSCEANLGAGSKGDFNSDKPRWNGKFKLEILRKCYVSVQQSLVETDRTIIINDRTTPETLEWMHDHTKGGFEIVNITPLNELAEKHPYPNYHPVYPNSCPELMEFIVQCASENPEEIIYICEDDYIHMPHAISALKAVYANGYGGFYIPYDYPDRYTLDNTRTCEVHIGPYGHLRSVPSATLTMAAKGKTWLQYRFELLRGGVFADDSWTWKAFKQVGAVCPIPGHATHLQEGCITPLINWSEIYDNIHIE